MPLILEFFTGLKWKLSKTKSRTLPHKPDNAYHTVAIRPGLVSCEQVQRWAGRRILSKNAPGLPVPGCTLPKCGCWYKHYADRRIGLRRLSDEFNMPAKWAGKERRAGPGRRATDRLPHK